jgi:hypothetical protein
MQDGFFEFAVKKCFERVNDRLFWNPGVFSYAMYTMIPRCRPKSRGFYFIVASIVYELARHCFSFMSFLAKPS